jgi:hypothetical protein
MAEAPYYRSEAKRCRELAYTAKDRAAAQHWHKIADEYALLAEEIDARSADRPSTLTTPRARELLAKWVTPGRHE